MRNSFSAVFIPGLLLSGVVRGQATFTGQVGTAPIEFVLEDYSPGESVAGVYMYTKHNSPIAVNGTLKGSKLTLIEKDAHGKPAAKLILPAFDADKTSITGTWKSLVTGRELPLTLSRSFTAEGKEADSAGKVELLQVEALPTSYFKLVVTNSNVTAVKLFDKQTSRLVQELELDCQSHGLNSVSVGDFNFDGRPDFSVFESSYAGPNTSSLYFLYNPATRRYVESGFTGTSLEFDAKKKRVYEHNTCCAGTSVVMAEYKVVRNKMVLVAEHCYRWDVKRQKLVERKPSACQ